MPRLGDPPKPGPAKRPRKPRGGANLQSVPEPADEPKLFPEAEAEAEADPQPVEEPGDEDSPAPAEAEKAKPKKRRPRLVPVPETPAAFKPDMSKLVPLEEKHDYLRVILYGDGGVGKTTSLCSLANRGRIVVVDPENSVRLSALRRQGIDTSNISLWPDWSYDGLEQLYVTIKDQLEREPGSILAVGVDTVTALSQFWLEAAVEASLVKPSMKTRHPGRTQWDVFQEDYGVITQQLQTMITRRLYQLPCHVIVTAHARRGENEDGEIRVGPALSPAAAQSLFTYSDWVLRLTLKDRNGKITRGLDAQPHGQIEAKDRFGVITSKRLLTMEELLDLWEEGGADEASD